MSTLPSVWQAHRAAQVYRTAWGEPHEHFDGAETLEDCPPGSTFEWDDNPAGDRRWYGIMRVEVLVGGLARLELSDFSLGDVALGLACLTTD
ncbi:hypothetical protein [Kitasatospora sp. NPDC092286]|uniref:hypothetical protein n=1 Tax=Kitasatospora sp. NPDC092286 TaxID=3364087 RepID=UPI0037FE6828